VGGRGPLAKKARTDGAAEPALDAQRREAEQLQAIGRLAGGVAHDFNNLLTSINGFAQLVLEDLPSDHPSVEDVKEILGAGQRAAELTNQLLAFSQRQILQPQVVDVGTLINNCAPRLRALLGEQIDVVIVLDRTPHRVSVDPAQFEQVLTNLAANAREAMPESGRFSIETSRVVLDEAYVGTHLGACPGCHTAIAVSDTGPGIDDETRAHVFEPFFTTKPQGKGAGLGLSTVYGIVTQSGGYITAEAGAGGGTTFRICLPEVAAEAEVEVAADVQRPPETIERPRGSETILLVDDEDSVRQLASQLLRKSGYTVIEAADGPAAVRLCRDRPQPVDLLLTDVVMPRMNGRELAAEVNALCPTLKVLYMSGFADHGIVHNGILDAGLAFLPKPLTMDSLTRKVRDVLDGG
jgi:nitrogen-specific signal transduction histidine kinase